MARVTTYRELSIDELVVERFQARKQNVGEGLEELADSITKYGLIQPIVVCRSLKHKGKWEIVCGQRRYLAHKQILNLKTIFAGIIDSELAYEEGLALSASENIVRLDMTRKDLIDLCAELHRKYGSIKDVVEYTKLPYPIVRKYIRFDGLPDDLQEKVKNNELKVDLAMKIQDAASANGSYDSNEAEDLIKVLKTVDDPIQKRILDLRKTSPTASLDKIVKKAEEPVKTLRISLVLSEALASPLREFAAAEDTDEKTAVEGFIETSLQTAGYMDSGE